MSTKEGDSLLAIAAGVVAVVSAWVAHRLASSLAGPVVARKWVRWVALGARSEPRGRPLGTILAVPGLERLSSEARAALLELAGELGLPVDSLAVVISHESRGRSSALNPLPAAGLIQITRGAGLPGLETAEQIRAVATWSDVRQVREVVRPFYRALLREHPSLAGATPGELVVANFLPIGIGKPSDFRLGDSRSDDSRRRRYYERNSGLDRPGPDGRKKGYITVGDLEELAAELVRAAGGKRLSVAGDAVSPAGAPRKPAKAPQRAGRGSRAPTASRRSQGAARASDGQSTRGLLLSAVEAGLDERVTWAEVPWRGRTVLVGEHALRAPLGGRPVRLPVSYGEALAIAKLRGWVLPTASLSDAIWSAAPVKLTPRPLGAAPRMDTAARVLRHDDDIERELAGREGLAADEGKDWILSLRNVLRPRGATPYGWRRVDGTPLQPLGPEDRKPPHDEDWIDESHVLRPIQRRTKEGDDLLELFEAEGIPRAVTNRLR